MKILFVSNDFLGFGGIQQVVRDFLSVAQSVSDIRTVMCKGSGFWAKVLFALQIFYRTIVYRPQFIIYNHINYAPISLALFWISKIPYAFMVYGVDAWDIGNPTKIRAMRRAHSIISSSHFTQLKIQKDLNILSSKFFILEPTLDTDRFLVRNDSDIAALRASQGLSGKKVILYVGRLSKKDQYKGYDTVVKALPMVLQSVPEAMYVIFGGGDDKERIEQLVAEQGTQEKVVFTGALSDERKTEYYQSADVFIMPSTGEGFGIVYLEALSCGTPVIAGNVDASSEPLLGGELGLLVDPKDIKQVAESLVTILCGRANPLFYQRAYLRGRVVERFGHAAFRELVCNYISTVTHELQR